MAEGIMLTWFVLTGLSLAFVAIDIPKTPEATVLKWAFVILTAFTGIFGAFFYVLGCREPLKGTHAQYVSATWRQVLGSTMHCAAGDGIGIVVGAVLGAVLSLSPWQDFLLEYALGFGFGWAFFQAYAMRDMAGGSYIRSLRETFVPELVSMNMLMAGMVTTMKLLMPRIDGGTYPLQPAFWFVMSMALIIGFTLAYPVNWWLVTRNLKHGMLTVHDHTDGSMGMAGHDDKAANAPDHDSHGSQPKPETITVFGVIISTTVFLLAILFLSEG